MKKKLLWISLILFILLCFGIEWVGRLWTEESVHTWYTTLKKPSWTPPNWLFGPVWTLLYIMIAIAGWLLYRARPSQERSEALTFYGIQLALNFLWSLFFFSLRNPAVALVDILLLCLFILLTIVKSWKVQRTAALLLIPYFLWVLFATSLNATIWFLNRG